MVEVIKYQKVRWGYTPPYCSCEDLRELTFIVPFVSILVIWHPTEAINYKLNQNTV